MIPLHGEVELVIPNGPFDPEPRTERLRPGSFVYYPAWQHHTIRNPGARSVAYLMFKWADSRIGARERARHRGRPLRGPRSARLALARSGRAACSTGPTGCLGKLHAHATVLAPGRRIRAA